MDSLVQDLRYALRTLLKARGFTTVAVLTLALGIGANTAIFSVVNRVLLEALPYRDAGQVLRIYGGSIEGRVTRGQLAPADFVDYQREQSTFRSMAAFGFGKYNFVADGQPQALTGARVSASMFQVLETAPLMGRVFREGEDGPGQPPVVVLGYAAWQREFGGDRGILGRSVALNGTPHEVIGVLGPEFVMPTFSEAQLWVPLDLTPVLRDVNRARKFHFLGAIGRLRDGVTAQQGTADLQAIAQRLSTAYPESNSGSTITAVPLRDAIVGDVRPALTVLMVAAVVVLLIACANVAGVTLSRTIARRSELSVRGALGAGRGRLIRQLLTESVVLAVVGGGVGLALAYWGTAALGRFAAAALPTIGPIAVDPKALLVTAIATLVCGVGFGLIPALVGSREIQQSVRESGRAVSAGISSQRLRGALVAGQLALATVLSVSAGLLVRTLMQLQQVDLGYTTPQLLTFVINLPDYRYGSSEQEDQFYTALHQGLRSIPGVQGTATIGNLPLEGGSSASLAVDGRPVAPGRPPEVGYLPVSDDYFGVMRIPLRRGRPFDSRDQNRSGGVVIVSEGLARQVWPGADPIGARVRLGPDPTEPWSEVVGVVGDVRLGVSGEPRPTAYVSAKQDHWGHAAVIVRAATGPMTLVPAIRQAVRAIDPTLPITDVRTMDEVFDRQLANRRLPMQLISGFALMAVGLAAIGVYGVLAYVVALRTREFGIRMALGAGTSSVLALVARQGLRTAAIGLAVGIAGAALATRLFRGLLFGVQPLDPLTFAGVVLLLLLVTAAASLLPGRRAARVDPMVALRSE